MSGWSSPFTRPEWCAEIFLLPNLITQTSVIIYGVVKWNTLDVPSGARSCLRHRPFNASSQLAHAHIQPLHSNLLWLLIWLVSPFVVCMDGSTIKQLDKWLRASVMEWEKWQLARHATINSHQLSPHSTKCQLVTSCQTTRYHHRKIS